MSKLTFGFLWRLSPVAMSCLTASALAQSYQFHDLTAPGGSYSTAVALNNVGQIVGATNFTSGGDASATEWTNEVAKALLTPVPFQAADINDKGQIAGNVGGFLPPGGYSGSTARAALLDQSGLTIFSGFQPQAQGSQAKGINNLGQVVGYAQTTTAYQDYPTELTAHAALFSIGNAPKDLGTLGGSNSFGYAINNLSQAVGLATTSGDYGTVPTLWSGGKTSAIPGSYPWTVYDINDKGQSVGSSFRDLSYLVPYGDPILVQTATLFQADGQAVFLDNTLDPNGQSVASAVNQSGIAVGYSQHYSNGNGLSHGTLWEGGISIDLNSFLDPALLAAGWYIKDANDINDAGSIVGDLANSQTFEQHAYLLTVAAVPEPSTYGLMLAGGAMMLLMRKRARAESPPKDLPVSG